MPTLAKSNPRETLREHTQRMLNELRAFKKAYGSFFNLGEKFWNLAELACFYHDLGKVDPVFQEKLEGKSNSSKKSFPHNFLSVFLIDSEQVSKEFGTDLLETLIYAVMFHHDRDDTFDKDYVNNLRLYALETLPNLTEVLKEELEDLCPAAHIKFCPQNLFYVQKWLRESPTFSEEQKRISILLKGILHRIDHSASAHVPVEITPKENLSSKVEFYIKSVCGAELRDIQKFAKENCNKNIVLVASTGSGKTEAALLWSSGSKTFFTLPVRTSINSIYKRLTEKIGFSEVGLLHSTNIDFLYSETENFRFSEYVHRVSKLLSYPISVSTVDQVFTFSMKFHGFEKILATLSYSKVIVDEIQSYSPKIAAVILNGLKQIVQMGGKFMVMTATLPTIFLDYIDNQSIPYKKFEWFDLTRRHVISIEEKDITEDIDKMIHLSREHSVLVITNTVKKSKEVYEELKKRVERVYLLNSMFTLEDRTKKEEKIMNSSKGEIWVATQIVEASLDIDFDYLFTELSTADSLFQRMGRCYRKRTYEKLEPNVFIYSKSPSGIGTVYDRFIHQLTLKELENFDKNEIDGHEKAEIVASVYHPAKLENTSYKQELDKAMMFLEHLPTGELKKSEAQRILRETYNITVIPVEKYNDNIELFDTYRKTTDPEGRFKLFLKIRRLTLDVPFYKFLNSGSRHADVYLSKIEGLDGIYVVHLLYNSETGLEEKPAMEDII